MASATKVYKFAPTSSSCTREHCSLHIENGVQLYDRIANTLKIIPTGSQKFAHLHLSLHISFKICAMFGCFQFGSAATGWRLVE